VINLTRQLARDFSPEGVRVNAVAPGVVAAGMATQELDDPETAAYKREKTLLDRFGTEQDVANAVLFLASAAASFVTGETLVVDGGWRA
jgi:NAD(P)-dependent dehydrogenase (short-subunit alcohol dehydrogenase family)